MAAHHHVLIALVVALSFSSVAADGGRHLLQGASASAQAVAQALGSGNAQAAAQAIAKATGENSTAVANALAQAIASGQGNAAASAVAQAASQGAAGNAVAQALAQAIAQAATLAPANIPAATQALSTLAAQPGAQAQSVEDNTCSALAKLTTDALYRGDTNTAARLIAAVFQPGSTCGSAVADGVANNANQLGCTKLIQAFAAGYQLAQAAGQGPAFIAAVAANPNLVAVLRGCQSPQLAVACLLASGA
ncbi:hypothetical protein N2152v2_000324 [Parachlorella kessleri]